MLGTTVAGRPSPEERRRAIRTVKRHVRDSHDAAEVLAMLGLDRTDAPAPEPRHPHRTLTADELREMLAPLAAEHAADGEPRPALPQ